MRISSISSYNVNSKYNQNSKVSKAPAFERLTPSGDMCMLLSEQARDYKISNYYCAKAESIRDWCAERASIMLSQPKEGKRYMYLSIPEISKQYQKVLGECKLGEELKWFMNLGADTVTKAKADIEDIVLEKRLGVLLKSINNDKFYDKIMKEYNPSNDKSVYNVVHNMNEEDLIEMFYFNPKGNDREVRLARQQLEEKLDRMAENNPKFKDTKLRQTIIQAALAKL